DQACRPVIASGRAVVIAPGRGERLPGRSTGRAGTGSRSPGLSAAAGPGIPPRRPRTGQWLPGTEPVPRSHLTTRPLGGQRSEPTLGTVSAPAADGARFR